MNRQPTAEGKLRAAIEVSFDYFHKNELVSKVMAMDQGFVLAAITQKNQEFQKISMAGLRNILEQGMKDGEFRELDAGKTALRHGRTDSFLSLSPLSGAGAVFSP